MVGVDLPIGVRRREVRREGSAPPGQVGALYAAARLRSGASRLGTERGPWANPFAGSDGWRSDPGPCDESGGICDSLAASGDEKEFCLCPPVLRS